MNDHVCHGISLSTDVVVIGGYVYSVRSSDICMRMKMPAYMLPLCPLLTTANINCGKYALFLNLESLTKGALSTEEYFQGLSDIRADVLGGDRWSIRSRN